MRRASRVLLIAVIAAAMIGFAASPAAADADIAVTMTGAPAVAKVGDTVTFTATVTNFGPEPTTTTEYVGVVTSDLSNVSWTCVGAGGVTCPVPSGTTRLLNQQFAMPVDGVLTLTITGTIGVMPPAGRATQQISV